jgi:hypothetical protein
MVNYMIKETVSSTAMREGIEALRHMTVGQLKQKYGEVFGEASRSNHKQFLFRRIAWRMQANAWGGLSERARRRALEIADDADLRIRAPRNFLKAGVDRSRAARTDWGCERQPSGLSIVGQIGGLATNRQLSPKVRNSSTGCCRSTVL